MVSSKWAAACANLEQRALRRERANLEAACSCERETKQNTALSSRESALIRNVKDAACQRPDDDESRAPEAVPPRSSSGRRKARWTHG